MPCSKDRGFCAQIDARAALTGVGSERQLLTE
jgi:hypothetical protein